MALSTTGGDSNKEKREAYLWGSDGFTGRLGLGFEFYNPEKEDEMGLD